MTSDPLKRLNDAVREMHSHSFDVAERVLEVALTSTTLPFHVHVWTWMADVGPDKFQLMTAASWHVADQVDVVHHPFGEEPPCHAADPASTACATPASPVARGGDAPASTS